MLSVRVFAVTHGALVGGDAECASESALRGFLRVAINEYPNIDIRIVDIESPAFACGIAAVVHAAGQEREWIIGAQGVQVTRERRGLALPVPLTACDRSSLHFNHAGRLDSFTWVSAPRAIPADDEIEVEIRVVGLNFRDVLVGLGVLDDDLLGAGLTAASLGFECAGHVTRIGRDVKHLVPGDPVMGFAAGVFASHVTASGWQFFRAPSGMSLESAATIPVAFATAWYGLVERAQLKAGETVLIHGAAGGVGLAAIQIARHLGARIIGTASDSARRAIAKAAGAELLFDSRHERFADMIKRQVGGVDVVLNSLAGSAMQASFELLKPFGRFIELGKRDYLDNSQLGLRPFVRNISYAGVDLDELLAHDRPLVERMMASLSELLGRGLLHALPFQAYEAHEIGDAFRSMQASEHVGKIVVRTAQCARPDLALRNYRAKAGLHIVIGGTTGLGFETARWLARKGAKTILIASRRGEVDPDALPALNEMRTNGAQVIITALDVCDRAAVRSCIEKAVTNHGPVLGVVHAAVHLDDGLISSLEPKRLRTVLTTKVEGLINLDLATRDQPLNFFVVYSSATTIVGSPGQSAYVAANAFLEGWARQARAAGRPALAIGWGAISDAGIIARDKQLGERLRRTTGVIGIRSGEGLAHLGRLLASGSQVDPVQFYSNISQSSASDKLALLKSPAFVDLGLTASNEDGEEARDLASMIVGKEHADALDIVTMTLRREVAHILRMPEGDVDPTRPLGDLGLDSLMGLELHLGIERISGMQMPMIGASDRRLIDVSAGILKHLSQGMDGADAHANNATATALAATHSVSSVTADGLAALHQRLQTATEARSSA